MIDERSWPAFLQRRSRRGALAALGVGAAALGSLISKRSGTAEAATPSRKVENFGVPWEEGYGYAQAIQVENRIYLSGQLSHDLEGNLVAPAPVDDNGKITDFANMGPQLAQTYANCKTLLARFGATLDDAVEEVVYVLNMDAAFAAIPDVRVAAWGKKPVITSTILETPRLALPPQLCEIKMIAVV